jgi:hypothetical protein
MIKGIRLSLDMYANMSKMMTISARGQYAILSMNGKKESMI